MKTIFRLKYKLHYLINCLFYILFFIIGFLVGGGSFEEITSYIGIYN